MKRDSWIRLGCVTGRGKPIPSGILEAVAAVWMLLSLVCFPGSVRGAEADHPSPHKEAAEKTPQYSPGDVAVRVNGVEITRAEVQEKMAQMLASGAHDAPAGEAGSEALWKDALRKLVLQELAYQRAKSLGMTVSAGELDNAVAEIKSKVGSEEKYREGLKERHITEDDLRKKLERNLLVKDIFTKEVAGKIVISDEDLKREYENVKDQFSVPENVVIDDMVLFLSLDDERSVDIAGGYLRKIQEDPERNPWNIPSDGSFAVSEREITKDNPAALYAEARKLEEGGVSGVIRTSDSFHIIRLKKYRPPVEAQFEQLRGTIERRLHAQAQQKKMDEWENELKKGAAIEVLPAGEKGL